MNDASARTAEIAVEQQHVDRVYQRLEVLRAETAEARRQGYRIAQAGNHGALVDRDAMVYQLSKRLQAFDSEYEGLVFGRLDLDRAGEAETLHIGRLGMRDERYRTLLVDWRAPAAAAFYRATPEAPMDVVRRRVIRCSGQRVVDVQDDLLDPDAAPAELAVVGEGALLATLARATGNRMKDIVATIAREQDEAVRAPAFGAALITGGPGTGKTAVALHRAAYLLYSDRNRFEGGGVLIVGPSTVFMRYIERVLPSLGENTVTLRSLGEVLDGVETDRRDPPAAAAVKGSLRMARVLRRAVRDGAPGAPTELRLVYAGLVLKLTGTELAAARRAAHEHGAKPNTARRYARAELLSALWRRAVAVGGSDYRFDRAAFDADIGDRGEFHRFVHAWWPFLSPGDVLGWLGDPERLARYGRGVLSGAEVKLVSASMMDTPSVADVALADELRVMLGEPPRAARRSGDPYRLRELSTFTDRGRSGGRDGDLAAAGTEDAAEVTDQHEDWALDVLDRATSLGADRGAADTGSGRPEHYDEYTHIVVDEAQDLSPMQWRMLGRRSRYASWTIVGDSAQSAWPDPAEADRARDRALRGKRRYTFELGTNYRNTAEIFALAARVVRVAEPDLPLPKAVRSTGVKPAIRVLPPDRLAGAARAAVTELAGQVPGTIGVIAPGGRLPELATALAELLAGDRVALLSPLESKGMEYDGVVVVEPERIAGGTTGGVHTLYVVLSRATQRLTVLTTEPGWPDTIEITA